MVQHFPQPSLLSACTLVVVFFLPVEKHCQSTFFFSLNLFTIHLDANYVCPSVKNLTLSTCLLSFVCDSILNIEKVHNILIFAKFLSYSVGGRGDGGGGGYFLGISTLKQTLTLVILPCEILSKSDLIYQKKNVANSENWAVSMHLPIKLFAFRIKDVRNIFCGLWSKPFTTFINNVLLSEKPGKKFSWRKSLSIAFVIILSFK